MPLAAAREQGLVVDLEPRAAYFQHLKTLVDLEVLKRSGLKVVVDVLYGTGRDYLDTFLQEAGVEVELLNGYRDAYFGGHRPEPSEEFLQDLSARVRATGAHLGLAVDADADRFGVMDAAGVYRDANIVLGLLFDYLIETRGWEGGVARSVATTHLLDRIAARYNRPVYVTKVGFKHLGEYINNDQVVMVGEESEGFSMKHHLPEKDGILAGIMVAEMVARKGKGLPELIADLFAKVGPVYNRRLNFSLTPAVKERLLVRLKTPPARFAGLAVAEHITLDGHKYLLADGSWVCFRPSGTEPVVRFYFEASSLDGTGAAAGRRRSLDPGNLSMPGMNFPYILEAALMAVVLLFSVIVHEVAHGYVALLNGDPTARIMGRITLNPVPHIDPVGTIILPFAPDDPCRHSLRLGQAGAGQSPQLSQLPLGGVCGERRRAREQPGPGRGLLRGVASGP